MKNIIYGWKKFKKLKKVYLSWRPNRSIIYFSFHLETELESEETEEDLTEKKLGVHKTQLRRKNIFLEKGPEIEGLFFFQNSGKKKKS